MIVVLDTNVIISALLSPSGPPAEIIDHWEADDFDVVTSPPLLSELKRAPPDPKPSELQVRTARHGDRYPLKDPAQLVHAKLGSNA